MNISELTLKLIILLIPGIISANIYGKLTFRSKPKSNFMFTLTAIVFGIISYLMLQITCNIYTFCNNLFSCHSSNYNNLSTFKDISGTSIIPFSEVLWASCYGILIGFIAAGIDTKKIINLIGNKLSLTNKYGDENLYMWFLNKPDIDYLYVRDIVNKITYFGYIDSYSETEGFKELVMGNVSVYNYPDSELMYEVDKIYLSLPVNNIVFEFPKTIKNGTET
jgi:hypothetical protein